MVEREAQIPGDRAKIAAVIYNRLRAGMPLGIDASIYYAVELNSGVATYTHELTEAQLHIDSPYNTRTHMGLPPTPISNPGMASIEAAAHPAHVAYLYYVAGADGCGEQVFSNTLAEFETNAAAYKAAVARNGGHPPTCKQASDAAARRPRLAGRAQPLAGDPKRRAGGAADWTAGATSGCRCRRRCSRRRCALSRGWASSARTSRSRTSRRRSRSPTDALRAAREIGAANTLTFAADGAIAAENTDAPGLIAALGSLTEMPAHPRVLVLGAGGSARAAVWALRGGGRERRGGLEPHAGARRDARARARRPRRAQARSRRSARQLHLRRARCGPGVQRSATEQEALNQLGLTFDQVGKYSYVVDFVYRAGSTQLLAAAAAHGAGTVDGLEVLVAQGALSFELWTGRQPSAGGHARERRAQRTRPRRR